MSPGKLENTKESMIVNGYIKGNLKDFIPKVIINEITLYYYDELKYVTWNNDETWKSECIHIKPNNIIEVEPHRNGSIFLSNEICTGKYIYNFKMNKLTESHNWQMGIGLYKVKYGDPVIHEWFSQKANACYCFIFAQGIQALESTKNPGTIEKDYGVPLKTNDMFKLVIDLDECILKYIVNDKDYGIACNIEKTKYKIGVTLLGLCDIFNDSPVSIQFISCDKCS